MGAGKSNRLLEPKRSVFRFIKTLKSRERERAFSGEMLYSRYSGPSHSNSCREHLFSCRRPTLRSSRALGIAADAFHYGFLLPVELLTTVVVKKCSCRRSIGIRTHWGLYTASSWWCVLLGMRARSRTTHLGTRCVFLTLVDFVGRKKQKRKQSSWSRRMGIVVWLKSCLSLPRRCFLGTLSTEIVRIAKRRSREGNLNSADEAISLALPSATCSSSNKKKQNKSSTHINTRLLPR